MGVDAPHVATGAVFIAYNTIDAADRRIRTPRDPHPLAEAQRMSTDASRVATGAVFIAYNTIDDADRRIRTPRQRRASFPADYLPRFPAIFVRGGAECAARRDSVRASASFPSCA